MALQFTTLTLLVRDYDEALAYYVGVLGFALVEDTNLGYGKRWVLVAPTGAPGARLLLARAVTDAQVRQIGNQAGGRVFLFLHSDNFAADYARLRTSGVRVLEQPRRESYGRVVVFEDLYGNKWDLLGE